MSHDYQGITSFEVYTQQFADVCYLTALNLP
jgi:hypothetical protein